MRIKSSKKKQLFQLPNECLRINELLTPEVKDLIQPNRIFVYEGNILYRSKMKSKNKKYYAFLFNDLLIIAQSTTHNKYHVKKTIILTESTSLGRVRSEEVGNNNLWIQLKIKDSNVFFLKGESFEETQKWLESLSENIDALF